MKKSNKLILILIVLYTAGLIFTDYLLKIEYGKIDLLNQFKNYEMVQIDAFKSLYLRGGNGFAIKILQGKFFDMKVMKSRKGFLKHSIKDSILYIEFNVAKMDLYNAHLENIPVGLIITCPELSAVNINNTYTLIDSLNMERLVVISGGNSFTRLRKNTINHFSIVVRDQSYTEFIEGNKAGILSVNLSDRSVVRLNDTKFIHFNPVVQFKSEIILSASSIAQLKFR